MSFVPPPNSFEFKPGPGLFLPRRHHKLIGHDKIVRRTAELAKHLDAHMLQCHAARVATASVWLLDGGARFFTGLQQLLVFKGHIPISCKAKSYDEDLSKPLEYDQSKLNEKAIKDKVIYLIDDIVDSAQTMCLIKQELLRLGARLVITVSLLDKPKGRKPTYQDFVPDVAGFKVPKVWVFGYSMDDGFKIGKVWKGQTWPLDNEWVRNLDDIFYYDESRFDEQSALVIEPGLQPLPRVA